MLWTLRGGTDPDAAGLAAMLAERGIEGLNEALVFGIGGGIGAGYILWEFQHDDSRTVVLGFHNSWQYVGRRTEKVLERLGIKAEWHRTGGTKAAATFLTGQLAQGNACMVWPDRFQIGYWGVPEWLDGHGGHPVVVYAEQGGRAYLDDRNTAPLTVAREDLDRARARVGSWKNMTLVITDRDRVVDPREAIRAGLRDVVEHLSAKSDSFSLPAWRKWSRMMTDTKNAKAWPKVFADGRGLDVALQGVREGVDGRFGITGGNLRPLFADFLEQAGLPGEAPRWRDIAEQWHELGALTDFKEMGEKLAVLHRMETDGIARLGAIVEA